jgi:hypothetical protein
MLTDQLNAAIHNLTQLLEKATDPDNRKLLLAQQDQLSSQLQAMIDTLATQSLPEYAAAASALEEANQMAEAAKADLDKVAATLTAMAGAIDKVAGLAAKIGLA